MARTSISSTVARAARRTELVNAALAAFSSKGVAGASVDDIVRAAGVAKGTFYLYFATKDDAVNAVAEAMVDGIAEQMDALVSAPGRSPVERLLGFATAIDAIGVAPYERDLIEVFHRPENRAIHDRMSERTVARLRPLIATLVADGIAEGLFRPQDPGRAAAFVMACFGSLHEVVTDPADVPAATGHLNEFVLRGLGYTGEMSA
jgi:AcrR family transcriptional regulator